MTAPPALVSFPGGSLLEAAGPERRATGIQSHWRDLDIRWFDSGALGWRFVRKDAGFRPIS